MKLLDKLHINGEFVDTTDDTPVPLGTAGQVLTVQSDGTGAEWKTPESGLPETTAEDAGKVLTVGEDGVPAFATASSGGVTMDLLWKNASPTSTFYEQDLDINRSGYKFILIIYNQGTNHQEIKSSHIIYNGTESQCFYPRTITSTRIYGCSRYCNMGDENYQNKIHFETGYDSGTLNNNSYIPDEIYGIK